MFGIGFMVYQEKLFGVDLYLIGFTFLLLAAVMTLWSMMMYLRLAWPSLKTSVEETENQSES
jgi:CDP-diacylglycerol--glycerol-3-phosphate 3-phosphatidyltransferase/cardiolipin synthase